MAYPTWPRFIAFYILLSSFFLPRNLFALEKQEPKIQARVDFVSAWEWERFKAIPDLDLMKVKPGEMARIVTDKEQLEQLRSQGFAVTVEIEHLQEFYATRMSGDNFGAFHTYSETEEFLDDLHAAYPHITTSKMSIGVTHEERDIWAMRISDNPDMDEGEPEVLFDALHHGGEIEALEVLLHYMSWLCENYGMDPEATYLVENREIWFVPIVNPDGAVYNEMTYPSGGGLWRKNRRDNADGTWGVDLNRNYTYEWGLEPGSSGDPASTIYRGPDPGSEPEVCAMMNLMKAHRFVSHITFHCCCGCVLLPWSYTEEPPEQQYRQLLQRWGNGMVSFNGYVAGQAAQTLYLASGTTKDYAFGERHEKDMIFSCTLEVAGHGGSWNEDAIQIHNDGCLWPQIFTTWVAGVYLETYETSLTGGNDDSKPDPGETLQLIVTVENHAIFPLTEAAEGVVLTLRTDDPYVQLHDACASLGTISLPYLVSNEDDPFRFSVDHITPEDHVLKMTIVARAGNIEYEFSNEVSWVVGPPFVSFSDDMEDSYDTWDNTHGRWGLTTSEYHSPSTSYADSPGGKYRNISDTWIELEHPIDMTHVQTASLSFWHKYETEENFDLCYVEVSDDGGIIWHRVGPVYHGTSEDWEHVELSLDEHIGTSAFTVRFRLQSDAYVNADGWYIDDVLITEPLNTNTVPSAPILVRPAEGSTIYDAPSPTLAVNNSSDPDPGDELTYGFFVYSDKLCTDLVSSSANVVEQRDRTEWTVDVLLEDGTYWWRAYAEDGCDRGPLMRASSFTVESTGAGMPTEIALLPGMPNPFEEETELRFELPQRSDTKIIVYDLIGRAVRRLVEGERGPGRGSVVWDGSGDQGRGLASGLYVVKLDACGKRRYQKVVLLR